MVVGRVWDALRGHHYLRGQGALHTPRGVVGRGDGRRGPDTYLLLPGGTALRPSHVRLGADLRGSLAGGHAAYLAAMGPGGGGSVGRPLHPLLRGPRVALHLLPLPGVAGTSAPDRLPQN